MRTASDSPSSQIHQTLAPAPGVTPPPQDGASYRFLSDVIMARELVDPAAMKAALQASLAGRNLTEILVERGDIGEADLARASAEHHGLDYVDLDLFEVDPDAPALIGAEIALRIGAIPIGFLPSGALVVAVHDPTGTPVARELALLTDREIQVAVATRAQIVSRIEAAGSAGAGAPPAAQTAPAEPAAPVADTFRAAPPVAAWSTHPADVLRPTAPQTPPADRMPSRTDNDEHLRAGEHRARAAEEEVSAANARAEDLTAAAVTANEALARAVGDCEMLKRDAAQREGEMQALRAELASERRERTRLEARLLEQQPGDELIAMNVRIAELERELAEARQVDPPADVPEVAEVEAVHEVPAPDAYVAPVTEPVVEEECRVEPAGPEVPNVAPASALTIDIPGTPGVPYVKALAPMRPAAAPRKVKSAKGEYKEKGLRRLIGALKRG